MIENPPTPLTPQQVQAAQWLARGRSTYDITHEINISDVTLYRWKKKKAFRELVEKTIADELAETRFRLAHIVDASISSLWSLVKSCDNDHTRLQAILHVLKLAGVVHLPSPNVTQTVQWALKHEEEEEPEKLIVTNAQGESRVEELPGQ